MEQCCNFAAPGAGKSPKFSRSWGFSHKKMQDAMMKSCGWNLGNNPFFLLLKLPQIKK